MDRLPTYKATCTRTYREDAPQALDIRGMLDTLTKSN